jgi:hypothetical protein
MLFICSCAHQRDLPPEDLQLCDKNIIYHLNTTSYSSIIQSLPSKGENPDAYCTTDKKNSINETILSKQIQSVINLSKLCKDHKTNGSSNTGFNDDISVDASEEDVLKMTKKKCGIDSVLHNSLIDLKNMISLEFSLETTKYEKSINEQMQTLSANQLANEQETAKAEQDKKIEKEKQEAYNNSEESYYSSLCSFISQKKGYEARIARENKAAKISGFVDKNSLYKYGQSILWLDDMINKNSIDFKTKFKKNIVSNKCVCDYKNVHLGLVSCRVK